MTTNNTNTARLHRVVRATPERVYRAFIDADAMLKWLPPNGFTGKVHYLEAKVGVLGRSSSITNSFINGIIPSRYPSEEKVAEALSLLHLDPSDLRCAYCGDNGIICVR